MTENASVPLLRMDGLAVRLALWVTLLVIGLLAVELFLFLRLHFRQTIEAQRRAG